MPWQAEVAPVGKPQEKHERLLGIAAGLMAGALWGLVFVSPRMVTAYGGVEHTAGRFVVYGAVAACIMLLRRRRLPTMRQALSAIGFSVLGFTGYYLLLVLAVRDAGSELPTLIIGTIPLALMLLGKPQGLRWRALLPGMLLTAAGLLLMVQAAGGLGGHDAGAATRDAPHAVRGLLLAVGAMASWTVFALGNAAWLRKNTEVDATDWANWLGVASGIGGALLWMVAGPGMPEALGRPERSLFIAICIATGFGSAWLATVLWNMASTRLSPSLCGQLIVSETLFGLFYSFLWDQQLPTPVQFTACVLFTLGIIASIRAHR